MKTQLKGIEFEWKDSELLIGQDKVYFAIPKRYIFSLMRFIIRISQKEFRRKHGKKV